MVLNSFTYFPIAGMPLIVYLGIVTLVFFLVTGYLGYTRKNFKWHKRLAGAAILLAVLHGALGVLAYF